MPEDNEQYLREQSALETLISSEEFGDYCESGNHHSLIPLLQEYLDGLCIHAWRKVETHGDWIWQQCDKCQAEREAVGE